LLMRVAWMVILFLGISGFARGQYFEDHFKWQSDSLKRAGVPLMLHYYTYTWGPGSNYMYGFHNSSYLLWEENGKVYVGKAVECYYESARFGIKVSEKVRLDSMESWRFFKANVDSGLHQSILPFIYKYEYNGKTYYSDFRPTHPTYSTFIVSRTGEERGFSVNHDDILKGWNEREPYVNLNYETNIETNLYKLKEKIERDINRMEKRGLFTFR
jgi:hypothetical protein